MTVNNPGFSVDEAIVVAAEANAELLDAAVDEDFAASLSNVVFFNFFVRPI